MSYKEALALVVRDERSHRVPTLFIVKILIICEDLGLLKDV